MALTEDQIRYCQKLIKDYTEFLTREHKPEFYSVVLKLAIPRTNEKHILTLIEDARKQLTANN